MRKPYQGWLGYQSTTRHEARYLLKLEQMCLLPGGFDWAYEFVASSITTGPTRASIQGSWEPYGTCVAGTASPPAGMLRDARRSIHQELGLGLLKLRIADHDIASMIGIDPRLYQFSA